MDAKLWKKNRFVRYLVGRREKKTFMWSLGIFHPTHTKYVSTKCRENWVGGVWWWNDKIAHVQYTWAKSSSLFFFLFFSLWFPKQRCLLYLIIIIIIFLLVSVVLFSFFFFLMVSWAMLPPFFSFFSFLDFLGVVLWVFFFGKFFLINLGDFFFFWLLITFLF